MAVVAFSVSLDDLAVFADELLLEARLMVAARFLLLLEVPASVLAELLVALLDEPVPEVEILLAAALLDVEVAPPPEPLLVAVELPVEFAEPPVPDAAVFPVAAELDVSLLVLALVAEAFSVAAADFTSLAVLAVVAFEAAVEEFALFALLEAEFVSEFAVFALLEADLFSAKDEDLLAFSLWAALFIAMVL